MNKRNFLKTLGVCLAGVATAPLVEANEKKPYKRLSGDRIYVNFFDDKTGKKVECSVMRKYFIQRRYDTFESMTRRALMVLEKKNETLL